MAERLNNDFQFIEVGRKPFSTLKPAKGNRG